MPAATLDDVMKEITDITEAAKNGTLVDTKALEASLAAQVEKLVEAQVKEKMDTKPVRRTPGALIGEDGTKIDRSSRYFKHLNAFEQDGFLKFGEHRITPTDLYLAYKLMEKGHGWYADKVKAPSKDLERRSRR
jgi:hypothetical protein